MCSPLLTLASSEARGSGGSSLKRLEPRSGGSGSERGERSSRRVRLKTDEREQLCLYIDGALTERGVDVAALTASRGLGPLSPDTGRCRLSGPVRAKVRHPLAPSLGRPTPPADDR